MCAVRYIPRHTTTNQPACVLCNKPVVLELSKTDEDGHAVHEDCYVAKLGGKIPPKPKRVFQK